MSMSVKNANSPVVNASNPALPLKLAVSSAEWYSEQQTVAVRGWVLRIAQGASIKAELDGIALGAPHTSLPRPDVYQRYPEYGERRAGFKFAVKLAMYSGSEPDKLTVMVVDQMGKVLKRVVAPVRPALKSASTSTSSNKLRKQNPMYKYLFPNGDLTTAELAAAEKEDSLLVPLVMNKSEQLINHLSKQHGINPRIVWHLMDLTMQTFSKNVRKEMSHVLRVETYAKVIRAQLEVFRRNAHALKQLLSYKSVQRDRFFDVGCLYGGSLLSAADVGFSCVHGCELNNGVLERGRAFIELAKQEVTAEYKYFAGDVCELDLLPSSYNLVTVVNVLEHTPNLDRTIARLAEITAPDGLIYIFQNAFPSLYYVSSEPHYRIPLVMILPEELRRRVLTTLKLNEVVHHWPDYAELMTLFERYNLDAKLHEDCLGIVDVPPLIEPETVGAWEADIRIDADVNVRPALDPGVWREVEQVTNKYFRDISESAAKDPEYTRLSYFTRNWHFTLTKSK